MISDRPFTQNVAYWAGWTEFKAIRLAAKFPHIILKVFWLVVAIASIIGFVVQTTFLVRDYYQYNKDTVVEISHAYGTAFPAVTICNINPMRRASTVNIQELHDLMSLYDFLTQKSTNQSWIGVTEESVEKGGKECGRLNATHGQLRTMFNTCTGDSLVQACSNIYFVNNETFAGCRYDAYSLADFLIKCTPDTTLCAKYESSTECMDSLETCAQGSNFDVTCSLPKLCNTLSKKTSRRRKREAVDVTMCGVVNPSTTSLMITTSTQESTSTTSMLLTTSSKELAAQSTTSTEVFTTETTTELTTTKTPFSETPTIQSTTSSVPTTFKTVMCSFPQTTTTATTSTTQNSPSTTTFTVTPSTSTSTVTPSTATSTVTPSTSIMCSFPQTTPSTSSTTTSPSTVTTTLRSTTSNPSSPSTTKGLTTTSTLLFTKNSPLDVILCSEQTTTTTSSTTTSTTTSKPTSSSTLATTTTTTTTTAEPTTTSPPTTPTTSTTVMLRTTLTSTTDSTSLLNSVETTTTNRSIALSTTTTTKQSSSSTTTSPSPPPPSSTTTTTTTATTSTTAPSVITMCTPSTTPTPTTTSTSTTTLLSSSMPTKVTLSTKYNCIHNSDGDNRRANHVDYLFVVFNALVSTDFYDQFTAFDTKHKLFEDYAATEQHIDTTFHIDRIIQDKHIRSVVAIRYNNYNSVTQDIANFT